MLGNRSHAIIFVGTEELLFRSSDQMKRVCTKSMSSPGDRSWTLRARCKDFFLVAYLEYILIDCHCYLIFRLGNNSERRHMEENVVKIRWSQGDFASPSFISAWPKEIVSVWPERTVFKMEMRTVSCRDSRNVFSLLLVTYQLIIFSLSDDETRSLLACFSMLWNSNEDRHEHLNSCLTLS